jgi:hypothetical protein
VRERDLRAVSSRNPLVRKWLTSSCLLVMTLLVTSQASAGDARTRGPWPLASLAALGTITWRCDAARHPGLAPGLPALALGFRASPTGQSGSLRLVVGRRTVIERRVQPGQIIPLPYLHARHQRVEIAAGGEDGTLRAVATVNFAGGTTSGYCWSYMPPATAVQLFARR